MAGTLQAQVEKIVGAHDLQTPAYDAIAAIADMIPMLQQKSDTYRSAAKAFRDAAPSMPNPSDDAHLLVPNATVVSALDDAIRTMRTMAFDLNDISIYILSKVPEMKEEDNLGVTVQSQVLEVVTEVQRALQGTNKENPRLVHGGSKQSYFAARSELEMKLAPTAADAKVPSSISLRLALWELDSVTLGNIAVAFAELKKYAIALSLTFARNAKKIHEPRRQNNSMIS